MARREGGNIGDTSLRQGFGLAGSRQKCLRYDFVNGRAAIAFVEFLIVPTG